MRIACGRPRWYCLHEPFDARVVQLTTAYATILDLLEQPSEGDLAMEPMEQAVRE